MAVRRADLILVFRPMNVDKAVTRIGVFGIESVEPKDSGRHEIFRVGRRIIRAKWNARFEDRPRFGAVPDFFGDAKITERRLHAAFFGADSEARTGDWKRANVPAIASQDEALIAKRDVDLCSAALHG